MLKHPPIDKDKIYYNVAALGQDPDWQVVDRPMDFDACGNPNSEAYRNKLFGYDVKDFLAKQYR